ncbi:MAG: efflux RND transporter periplasmic adaptor subunit [Elusimicrobiales bacterium]|nr:efflux RND transporter periplasmic adaptor subunit [Elusimicrobiales bacterium]
MAMTKKRKIFFTIIGLVVILFIFLITKRVFTNQEKVQETAVIPVEAAKAKRQTVLDALYLTGDIKGQNEARVFPKVPGRVMDKIKDVGDSVAKNETLALVDRDEPALKYAPGEITSPLTGVITQYFVDIGEYVSPATPICEVADISNVKIIVYVPENDLPRVKLGQSVRFTTDAYPQRTFWGKVSKISQSLNTSSRSSEVEIMAGNSDLKLKPGMFARVDMIINTHPATIVVPRKAIREFGGENYVYVVKDNKAYRQKVTTGVTLEDVVQITSGISDNDVVITMGWNNITADGEAVEITNK